MGPSLLYAPTQVKLRSKLQDEVCVLKSVGADLQSKLQEEVQAAVISRSKRQEELKSVEELELKSATFFLNFGRRGELIGEARSASSRHRSSHT